MPIWKVTKTCEDEHCTCDFLMVQALDDLRWLQLAVALNQVNKGTLEWKCIYVFILSLCRIINLNLHLNMICTPTYAASLRQELYYARLQESCFYLFRSTPSKFCISRQQHTDVLNVTCSHLLISFYPGPVFNERCANGEQVYTTEDKKSNTRVRVKGDHRHVK